MNQKGVLHFAIFQRQIVKSLPIIFRKALNKGLTLSEVSIPRDIGALRARDRQTSIL